MTNDDMKLLRAVKRDAMIGAGNLAAYRMAGRTIAPKKGKGRKVTPRRGKHAGRGEW